VTLFPYTTLFRSINAVATHGRSHVIAKPKVLVDDNGSASISSVSESPFTSVNASTTVATTSFAGFAEAGTTLTVQPHINEGDHLALTYNLTFSSFTGGSSSNGTVPPPRSSNTISSVIEIPDGHTAVIGGLQTDREGDTVSEVPLLGRIPLLGLLFQNSNRSKSKSLLYAFIRPVILRDDRFEDLKFISQVDVEKAGVGAKDFPESQLQWMP
jgi:general secretion pathway protein D